MPVTVQQTRSPYTANGIATVFPFTCRVLQASHVQVTVNGVVQNSGFSVTGVGEANGGAVVFTVAPANLASVVIRRVMPFERATDYQSNGDLLEETLDDDQDAPVMMIQQLDTSLRKAIRAPDTDTLDLGDLPSAATRANKLMAFDANGQPQAIPSVVGTAVQLALDLIASTGASLVGFIQSAAGAVSRTLLAKVREIEVSVTDFGAAVSPANATAAFQAAASSGAKRVRVPSGTWLTTFVHWPTGVEVVLDPDAIIQPHGTVVANGPLWYFVGSEGAVRGGRINVNRTTYPLLIPIYLDTCTGFEVRNTRIDEGGRFGIYGVNCARCHVEDNEITTVSQLGILFEGASSKGNRIVFNRVRDVSLQHGIQTYQGSDHLIEGNEVHNTAGFGINAWTASRVRVYGNVVYDTVIEGINLDQSDSCIVKGNRVYWNGTASTDFGISVYGPSAGQLANFNQVIGNFIGAPFRACIALADFAQYNHVADNTCINPNRENNVNAAAILLYGTGCQNNTIQDNRCTDFTSRMYYGVAENNFSATGTPSNNRFLSNTISGFVTARVQRSTSTDEVLNEPGWISYVPTVTAGSGTFTTVSATGQYKELGKLVFYAIRAVITTNGTAATDVRASLPSTAGSAIAVGAGRESGLTGRLVSATISGGASVVVIRSDANTYPGGTGAVLEISGFYERA